MACLILAACLIEIPGDKNEKGRLVLAVILSLSACAGKTTGGEDKFSISYVESHIVKGKTTQREVQSLYGVPDDNEKIIQRCHLGISQKR